VIHSTPIGAAEFSFRHRRLGATGPQITQGIYTGIESGAMLVPVVGPFVAAAAAIAGAFGLGKGCGATCTESTQVVNQIEPILKQNLAAAQQQATANGGCLTAAEQTVLIQNFQSLWQEVLTGCGQIPAPGGTQCIADRQPGGKFDWTAAYLTPIQNMPVCPAAAIAPTGPSTAASSPADLATTTTPATITIPGISTPVPTSYLYLGIAALGLFLLVKR
jgi:hypothetical protein